MKKLLLSIAVVLIGNLAYASPIQPSKSLILNEAELSFADLSGCQEVDISGPVVPWKKLETYSSSKIINIALVSDKKYLDPTHNVIVSVLENSKYNEREESIRFIVIFDEPKFELGKLDSDISRFLNAFFFMFDRDTYKYDIKYIPIPDKERKLINKFDSYGWNKNIFLKLFFSNFLPYDKCIYLDGDTACVNDIRRMWNIDLTNKCFGAAGYRSTSKVSDRINAGGLLFNLQYMRNVGFGNEIEKILENGKKDGSRFTEEHALNKYSVLYPNRRFMLPHEFNVGVVTIPKRFSGQSKDSFKNLPEITIIHYYGSPKPWKHWSEALNWGNYRSWNYSRWALDKWCEYYRSLLNIKDLAENIN
jgi:lipopolysaccharide biosynthesis glycosyltransferase